MSGNSIEHLITMANQIVANIPGNSQQSKIENAAVHIQRFWSPSMKQSVAELLVDGGAGLSSLAAKALTQAVAE